MALTFDQPSATSSRSLKHRIGEVFFTGLIIMRHPLGTYQEGVSVETKTKHALNVEVTFITKHERERHCLSGEKPTFD